MQLRGSYQPVARSDIEPKQQLKREVVWKQLAGDVFRTPHFPLLLSCLIGAGLQIGCCFYVALLIGFVSALGAINVTA